MTDNLHILIVEDESLIALELARTIEGFGYDVVEYATRPEMAKRFLDNNPQVNLLLMDINLGNGPDGVDLYKSFETDTPVVYLTAYKDEKTIAKAVTTDPLGYLIKPHNDDELRALLKLALYKMQNSRGVVEKERLLDIGGGYFFSRGEDKLFYHDQYIHLSTKELQLLKLLIDARGGVVSYGTIETEVWSDKVVGDSSVRTLIYRLRGKLEHKLIVNEFNYGIRLRENATAP